MRRFLIRQHGVFVMALVMLIAEAITAIFAAYPLSYLIDYLKGDRPDLLRVLGLPALVSPRIGTVAALTIAVVLMAMINSAADSLAEIYLARGGRMLGFNLRVGVYDHLQRLSLAFFNRQRTGDILTRVTADVTALEEFVIKSLSDVVGSLLLLAGTLAYLLYRSWEVALVAALIVPGVALVSHRFAQRIKAASVEQRAREGDLASAAQEMLTSIPVIQTYGRGGNELKRFADRNQRTMEVALRAARIQAAFSWVVKLMEALSTVAIVWLGLWLIDRSAITLGTLILFVLLIDQMFKPTRKIIKEWNTFGRMYASAERIGELLDREPAVRDRADALAAPPLAGHIEYRHVSFAYPLEAEDYAKRGETTPRLALLDINLEIAPGEVVALVGSSGAGKSTIVQLLPRLYDPHTGQVTIDGHDIRTFTLESLRSQMSLVLQETLLFNGTVADNIGYGREDATRQAIVAAAIQANAHEFIEKLPAGYDTELGERAASLSGGQRQRIAIARAFIRRTPILVLDEPTTGLDAESTDLVLKALRTLMKGKSTIIISHDLNLIRHADRIVVIEQGRVHGVGTHKELLRTDRLYADLYHRQFGQAVEEHVEEGFEEGRGRGLAAPGRRTARARLEEAEIDPRLSPVLQGELPGLRAAFDGEAMRGHLQKALFEGANGHFRIVRCEAGDAGYLPDGTCLVRYELELEDGDAGPPLRALVSARIARDRSACAAYLRERLAPLAVLARGRTEVAPFTAPVAMIEGLNVVVHAFPIDGELPTLVAATDRGRMAGVLREAMPEAPAGRLEVEGCEVELARYARRSRAVLRYRVLGRRRGQDRGEGRTVYGKVFGDENGALAGSVTAALRERVMGGDGVPGVNIPLSYGWRPELRLSLLEAIPGEGTITDALKARREGRPEPPTGPSLEEMIGACGRIAALLHTSGLALGPPRTLDDELRGLRSELAPIQRVSPVLGARLRGCLERLEAHAARTRPLPLRFSHGDFTRGQVLFDGATAGLLDFDSICQAEPALDVGQFLAYLRLADPGEDGSSASGELAERLGERFMDAYLGEAGQRLEGVDRLRVRVSTCKVVGLMRRTMRSWQKFKGGRAASALAALEEEAASL